MQFNGEWVVFPTLVLEQLDIHRENNDYTLTLHFLKKKNNPQNGS